MAKIDYREDIDGLRAVAVLGVVIFHTGLALPGGFVGVDVFFVISGYLITRLIVEDLRAGTFSLRDFWMRRIRRILPAATVVTVATLAAGALLLDPVAFESLGKSAVAQSTMLANVHFWRDTGYFSQEAGLKPLLHMWSLAVEEQFYVFFPVALAIVYRFARQRLVSLMSLAAVVSFVWCLFQMKRDPSAAFFLLPSRAWELLLGGIVAAAPAMKLGRVASEWLAVPGLLAIATAMLAYTEQIPFPGARALLPVLGTVGCLLGAANERCSVSRVLRLPRLRWIGRISYSLYLWHWVMLAMAANVVIEPPAWLLGGLAIASVGVAAVSWRFIEEPFRRAVWLRQPKNALWFGGSLCGASLAMAVLVWQGNGWPSRFGSDLQPLVDDVAWTGVAYRAPSGTPAPLGTALAEPHSGVDFVLWGDSHGLMLAEVIDQLAAEHGLAGEAYLRDACVPVPGLWRPAWSLPTRQANEAFNQAVLDRIVETRVTDVLLAHRWDASCSGHSDEDVARGYPREATLVTNDPQMTEPDPNAAAASMAGALGALAERLDKQGTRLWVLQQPPEAANCYTARNVFLARAYPSWNTLPATTIDRATHAARESSALTAFDAIDAPNVRFVEFAPWFFDSEGRLIQHDELAVFRDQHHLSRSGARRYAGPLLDSVLRQVAMDPRRLARRVSLRASTIETK